jgi:hypothetical protein
MKLYVVLAVLCLVQLINGRPDKAIDKRIWAPEEKRILEEKRFFLDPAQALGTALNLGAGLVNAGTDVLGAGLQLGGQVAQGAGQGLQNLL